MEQKKTIIIVPWDFSQVAEYALLHAVKIARSVANDICLLHIVEKGTRQHKKDELMVSLNDIAKKTEKEYKQRVFGVIEEGSIFTAIPKYANENETSLVVMGTHGIKGMQRLTGSWALKVIVGSENPFIVVQEPPKDMDKFQNIVFPVDFKTENKEKLKMAIFMGKYFESKIHILKTTTTDKSLLRKTNINLNFAIKHLIQNNIEYEIHDMPKGSLAKQTIEYGLDLKADLILIITTKNITMADYMVGAQEQYLIANSSKIPVCCINPRSNFAKIGQFMFG